MKRRISICIIIFTVVLSTAIFWGNATHTPQETQTRQPVSETQNTEQATPVNNIHTVSYPYWLKDLDGNVVLYCENQPDHYMETGIHTSDLPMEIRERLQSGIGFETEEELFDFLESYSS